MRKFYGSEFSVNINTSIITTNVISSRIWNIIYSKPVLLSTTANHQQFKTLKKDSRFVLPTSMLQKVHNREKMSGDKDGAVGQFYTDLGL